MLHGVVQGRARRDAREERRLGERQLGGALAVEVGAGSLEDPVRAVAEVDRVQVRGQDPVLRPALGQLPGQGGLAHLAADRLLVAAVGVLDVLLRDRGAALDDALAADVLPERAHDAAHVDAVVLVEALVLDRDDRLLHDRRDVLGCDEDAALVATEDREHPALAEAVRSRVDDRVDVSPRLRRVERVELAADGRDQAVAEGRRGERKQHEQQRQEPRLPDPAAPGRGLLTSSEPHYAPDCSPVRPFSGVGEHGEELLAVTVELGRAEALDRGQLGRRARS